MSREIKFRVWDDHDRMWVSLENPHYVDPANDLHPETHHISSEEVGGRCILSLGELKGWWVIQQFTGLKDKNGREIYEGDVLKWWWDSEENGMDMGSGGRILQEEPVVVQFRHGGFGFTTKPDWRFLGSPYGTEKVEVIGNIHEGILKSGDKEQPA